MNGHIAMAAQAIGKMEGGFEEHNRIIRAYDECISTKA